MNNNLFLLFYFNPFSEKKQENYGGFAESFPIFLICAPVSLTEREKIRIIDGKSAVYGVRKNVIHVIYKGVYVRADRQGLFQPTV